MKIIHFDEYFFRKKLLYRVYLTGNKIGGLMNVEEFNITTINTLNNTFKVSIRSPNISWVVGSDIVLDREDLLQEVYLKFLENKHKDRLVSSEGMMYTFIINTIKNAYKASVRSRNGCNKKDIVALEDAEEVAVETAPLDSLKVSDVRATLLLLKQDLPGNTTGMLFDYYYLGMTYEEVAKKWGYSSKGSVKNFIDRNVKALEPTIKKYFKDIGSRV